MYYCTLSCLPDLALFLTPYVSPFLPMSLPRSLSLSSPLLLHISQRKKAEEAEARAARMAREAEIKQAEAERLKKEVIFLCV